MSGEIFRGPVSVSDEELMHQIKAGNMSAFDALYRRYSSRVYRFAYSIIKSYEDSENIVQDVFLAILENYNKIEKDISIRSYIFTITYNSAISVIRKKAKEVQYLDFLKSIRSREQKAENAQDEYNDLLNRLEDIIDRLPDRQKEVYTLHRVKGLKYREIAALLDISENTVENHITRTLKTIRKKLGSYSSTAMLFFILNIQTYLFF